MNIKKITTYTLGAIGTMALSTGFAVTAIDANKCVGEAARDAGFVLDNVKALFNQGHSSATFDAMETSYNGFVKGTNASNTKAGLVFSNFGVENGAPTNYIYVAYLGKSCGGASNTKMVCHLKHTDADTPQQEFGTSTTLNASFSRHGFYMDCIMCSGVVLAATGYEAAASASSDLAVQELAKSASTGLASAVSGSPRHGVILSSTVSTWSAGSEACSKAPFATSGGT